LFDHYFFLKGRECLRQSDFLLSSLGRSHALQFAELYKNYWAALINTVAFKKIRKTIAASDLVNIL